MVLLDGLSWRHFNARVYGMWVVYVVEECMKEGHEAELHGNVASRVPPRASHATETAKSCASFLLRVGSATSCDYFDSRRLEWTVEMGLE